MVLRVGGSEGGSWMYMSIYMISSLLSIGHLMPIVGRATENRLKKMNIYMKHLGCVLPPVLTAFGCLMLFVFHFCMTRCR